MTGGSWDAMLAAEHAQGLHGDGCACSADNEIQRTGAGTMTEPQWDSVKRSGVVAEEERGPDSVECSPTSRYPHHMCLLDYSDFGPRAGFVCGCGCHDIECGECGTGNGEHDSLCSGSEGQES